MLVLITLYPDVFWCIYRYAASTWHVTIHVLSANHAPFYCISVRALQVVQAFTAPRLHKGVTALKYYRLGPSIMAHSVLSAICL